MKSIILFSSLFLLSLNVFPCIGGSTNIGSVRLDHLEASVFVKFQDAQGQEQSIASNVQPLFEGLNFMTLNQTIRVEKMYVTNYQDEPTVYQTLFSSTDAYSDEKEYFMVKSNLHVDGSVSRGMSKSVNNTATLPSGEIITISETFDCN